MPLLFKKSNGDTVIKGSTAIAKYVTPLPSLFTSNTLTISGQPSGNGVYTISTSGNYDSITSDLASYNAFNGLKTGPTWVSGNGNSNGSRVVNISGLGNIVGDWIQIQIPYSLVLGHYSIFPWTANNGGAKTWYVVGSNDGTTWYQLDYQHLSSRLNSVDLTYFSVTNSVSYSYFKIIITEYAGNGFYSFASLSQFNIGT